MKKIKIERINSETGAAETEVVALDVTTRSSPSHDAKLLKANNDNNNIKENKVESPIVDSMKTEMDDVSNLTKDLPNSHQDPKSQTPPVSGPAVNQQRQPQTASSMQQQQTAPFPSLQRPLPPGAPANYCNICNKELCNKYFMKTHMQKMHGINLDDYPREAANSGGVVCDICQKELCSKYFLKVHKSNTHGITEFNSGSAGSQAANAATAVAAIALTNYSLNNAQKRAALNLALNQHQLQSRQAAALMNAAAASAAFSPLQMAQAAKAVAIHQRDQIGASTLIGQLQQQQNTSPQQLPFQLHHQQNQQQPQQLDLHKQAQLQSPTNSLNHSANHPVNIPAAFPAALLAATTSNPLLAAQLAHHRQQQQQQQQQYSIITSQQAGQQHQAPQSFLNHASNEEPIDTEEDTSDRDSLIDQSSDMQQKNRLAMSNFHQQLQSQQALLNAAAVFNPAAAAAAVMAMQQQQQHQLQLQQQHHHQRQLDQSTMNSRQSAAIDLRNQSISQLLAQQMLSARQREFEQQQQQQLQPVNNCNNMMNSINNTQAIPLCRKDRDTQQDKLQGSHLRSVSEDDEEEVGEEEQEEEFDSDRDSLVDEGIFRQAATNLTFAAASATTSTAAIGHQLAAAVGSSNTAANNDGFLSCSSISNDNDELINCASDSKHSNRLATHNSIENNIKASPTIAKSGSKPSASTTATTTTAINTNTSSNSQNKQIKGTPKYQQQTNRSNNTISSMPTNLTAQIGNLLSGNSSPLETSATGVGTATNLVTTPAAPPINRSTNNTGNSSNANNSGNNNRYLRHYTEACPICDRRFKSIKWLQSHVMNDHKNEIGNQLLNLLVQVLLCSNANNNSTSGSSGPGGDRNTGNMNGNQPAASNMSVEAEEGAGDGGEGNAVAGDMSMASLNGLLADLVGSAANLTAQTSRHQQNPKQAAAAATTTTTTTTMSATGSTTNRDV